MNGPKILILYESRHGQTAKIAEKLAAHARSRGAEATVEALADFPRDRPLEGLDLVAVGAPVHFGRHRPPTGTFVKRRLAELSGRPSAFFSVSGSAIPGTPDGEARSREYVDAFLEKTGWRPELVARFAGAVRYTRYNALLRFVIRRIEARTGRSTDASRDHEYTDWEAVEDFAREIVRTSRREATPAG